MKTKQTKIDGSAAVLLPGAMALAATAASSQAAVVQITLTGNNISSTGHNHLNSDVTGDGESDFNITNVGMRLDGGGVEARLFNDGLVSAYVDGSSWYHEAQFRAYFVTVSGAAGGSGPGSMRGFNHIFFTDSRINGGDLTWGWLEVHAFNTSATDHTVELTRLVFDDESASDWPLPAELSAVGEGAFPEWGGVSAVPEPTTNLGLLALGAGGLLTRRRLKRAA